MRGGIYAVGRCPVCEKPFKRSERDLICPEHLIRPKRFYIVLYDRKLRKHIAIYRDPRGYPFSSYEQAERILTRIRSEIDSGHFDATRYISKKLKPLQFSNWSKNWLQKQELREGKKRLSPSYLKELRRFVKIFQQHFGQVDIRNIGTKQVDEFALSLNGSPKYSQNILSCLHKMFSDALDWGDINLMPKFPEIEIPEYAFNTIDPETQDKIIEQIKDPMDKAYILFTARQMVRPSETRALFWEDLDLKSGRVVIRRHFSLNEMRGATKSKRIKVLPLDVDVKEALMKLPKHIRSPFVFWKGDGHPYSESYARKLWNKITSEMGVKISLYQGTRHSSATEAMARTDLETVKEFLGHTRSDMTKRYAKMNPDRLKSALRPSTEK